MSSKRAGAMTMTGQSLKTTRKNRRDALGGLPFRMLLRESQLTIDHLWLGTAARESERSLYGHGKGCEDP
jgi:hypothetical protein